MTYVLKTPFLNALAERDFIHQCTDIIGLESLALMGRQIVGYVGFDATADSLHVGNLVSLMMLRWLGKTGGVPIALLGTGTTRIGDPSDKTSSRPMLTDEQIRSNTNGIVRAIDRIQGSTGPERSWWTKDNTAPDFGTISGIGAVIAHSWPKKTGGYWLRLRKKSG